MRLVRAAVAPALAASMLVAASAVSLAETGEGDCAALTLDCGNAPARLCMALVKALSADHSRRGTRISRQAGPGLHMRLEMTRVSEDGMVGRLVRKAPGEPERATPLMEIVVLDHPGGLPDGAYEHFARELLGAALRDGPGEARNGE